MRIIKLTQGKLALVDDENFNWLNQWKWSYSVRGYAVSRQGKRKNKIITMHRLIMDNPINMEIDHINQNKLDNQRFNLRITTRQQNGVNRKKFKGNSKYLGVWFDKHRNNYQAYITINYKRLRIGRFESELHAAMARDIWAKTLFGEFASLNFIGKNIKI